MRTRSRPEAGVERTRPIMTAEAIKARNGFSELLAQLIPDWHTPVLSVYLLWGALARARLHPRSLSSAAAVQGVGINRMGWEVIISR